MEVNRRWWRRRRRRGEEGVGRFSLPTRDDFQPIDTQGKTLNQEEMVSSFEKKHAQRSLLWRRVFGAFILAYVAFLIYSILHQVSSPWDLRFHAYFMDEMHPWILISADCVAVLACFLAVKGLLHSSGFYHQWLWYSCYMGFVLAIFWLYYMLRLPRFRWDVIWLPFGPLSGAGISLYVDHLLQGSLEDIKNLRSSMYNYKAM